ncbi:MAG: hypothetical protein IPF57_03690 [Gammaproteobacteria bacterium]|nr:hypothetical protein [Gammaproteobacteria bacterium]
MLRKGPAVFADGIHLAGEVLKIRFDEIAFRAEFSAAVEDCDFGFMQIAKGCVAGVNADWHGIVNGKSVVGALPLEDGRPRRARLPRCTRAAWSTCAGVRTWNSR